MKRIFIPLLLALIISLLGCEKEPIVNDSADLQEFSFVKEGIKFTITPIESPLTKNSDINRSIVSAERDSLSFTFINEYEIVEDGLMIVRDFTENEILLATYIMRDKEVLDVELSPFLEIDDDYSDYSSGEFNPYRKDGEKYGECVKRVYREAKETINSHFADEIFCEFFRPICVGLNLTGAIIGCTLNKREYEQLTKKW